MADNMVQIPIDVPADVNEWLEKRAKENYRSKRGECAAIIMDFYRSRTASVQASASNGIGG